MSGALVQQRAAMGVRDENALVHLESTACEPNAPFRDNLDHLEALEREASLMLALGYLRNLPREVADGHESSPEFRALFPFLSAGTDISRAQLLLEETAAANRRREAASARDGVDLLFEAWCLQRRLGPFERAVILLLIMQFTSPRFMETFRRCRLEPEQVGMHTNDRHNGMLIGTLLSLACRDFREQVEARRHFSTDRPLIGNEIIVTDGVGESTNLLGTKVKLQERFVRQILGDRHLYRSSTRFIRRERCPVNLDQVVLPDNLKDEVVACVGNFMADRAAGRLDALDAFFGYGTGLALLFHGPPGTGKTMMARALATRFDRQIITLAAETMGKFHSPEDVLGMIFREAEALGYIVLLDECDDVFANDSKLGRALLVELEKARCVVILATNKPVDLDPAMERRVAMKVAFQIPDAGARLQMWRALLPDSLELAPDVDLAEIADRYQLSGGLIKNCLLIAMTRSPRRKDGKIFVTREQLERAVDLQKPAPSDEERICTRYAPKVALADIHLRNRERDGLLGVARAWQKLKSDGLGLTVLISTPFLSTGQSAAEALARECGLEVRLFNFDQLQDSNEANRLVDPLTQRKLSPMEYAFSKSLGANTMTLLMDYGDLGRYLAKEAAGERNYHLTDLRARLRSHAGLFCMVTPSLKPQPLPIEFHLHFALEQPSEDVQIRRWEERLGNDGVCEDDLVALVERWPMHVEEIDFIARQASIQSVIKGGSGRPGLDEVREVIERYRRTDRSPLLFGGDQGFQIR